ncbi:FprA family A-type flavoprotein [Sphaerochaeta sp.]|jgi:flavorubredoxin|uniref:FprA family A-type flavoprotein n=1 Tax=Sphaerochaeta sp. TaxID=1972642 RepID=UPI002A35E609|nr:FprA family A-type flavoprotein [Sphaerochaeta sp.]MDX9982862.1 FprA family A-type flavoprotein [Sphaerochaeta sp.]
MKPDRLADGVYRVAAQIGNRDLFEGIWPIPDGVMLNSYVVKGTNKRVLIDLVKDWDGALAAVNQQLEDLSLDAGNLDYIVINHMEPDHTGSMAKIVEKYPDVQILCSDKAVNLIKHFYKIEKNVRAVKDGETLDLGGKTLQFFMTPNIHWPETMMTFLVEDGILFSCDAFGSFGRYAKCFDDEQSEEELVHLASETERYYANIVSSFSSFVLRGIAKLDGLDIKVVAPSHGVVWRTEPEKIIDWYKRLATYMQGPREKEVAVVWSSMYGNTEALLSSVVEGIKSEGLPVHVLQVPQTHESFVLEKVWRSEGLVIGMPTYEYKMFPPMYHVLDILERSHVVGRKTLRFGSFGWSGGAQKQFDEFSTAMKLDCKGVIEYQGSPTEEDKKKAYELAKAMAKEIKG